MDAFFLQFCPEKNIIWEKRILFGQKRILKIKKSNSKSKIGHGGRLRLTIPSILEATANDDELQDDELD